MTNHIVETGEFGFLADFLVLSILTRSSNLTQRNLVDSDSKFRLRLSVFLNHNNRPQSEFPNPFDIELKFDSKNKKFFLRNVSNMSPNSDSDFLT